MTVTSSKTFSSTAFNALTLLLREDPRLLELNLTSFADTSALVLTSQQQQQQLQHNSLSSTRSSSSIISPNEEAAFAFAAALMHEDSSPEISGWISPSIQNSGSDVQSRAKEALADVDRKLALVTGLAERLVRDHPEQVSEALLRLHGFSTKDSNTASLEDRHDMEQHPAVGFSSRNNNLVTLRAKCDRLSRQSHVMESIATRIESSIQKQYDKLRDCTTRLQRVLALSNTLKMAMRLQFEGKKILGCGIDLSILDDQQQSTVAVRSKALLDVDLRDLTRAASSVATMENLLADPELYGGAARSNSSADSDINSSTVEVLNIVNTMRPEVRLMN